MTDWRATASAATQDDLDDLLDVALSMAGEQLTRQGVLAPFAIVADNKGDRRQLMVLEDAPDAQTLEATLMGRARAERDELRAAAFIADVTDTRLGGDAIRVILEHRDGIALAVYQPYSTSSDGPQFRDLIAGTADRAVWA